MKFQKHKAPALLSDDVLSNEALGAQGPCSIEKEPVYPQRRTAFFRVVVGWVVGKSAEVLRVVDVAAYGGFTISLSFRSWPFGLCSSWYLDESR